MALPAIAATAEAVFSLRDGTDFASAKCEVALTPSHLSVSESASALARGALQNSKPWPIGQSSSALFILHVKADLEFLWQRVRQKKGTNDVASDYVFVSGRTPSPLLRRLEQN